MLKYGKRGGKEGLLVAKEDEIISSCFIPIQKNLG